MPANLENSAVATRWEKVCFHSNPQKGQYQRMFKLPYNCAHFTCQQDYAQNPSNQTSTVHELRTFKCTSWVQKRQRNQRSNCQHFLAHRKQESSRKTSTSASLTMLKLLTVWITTNCRKFLEKWDYQTTLPVS